MFCFQFLGDEGVQNSFLFSFYVFQQLLSYSYYAELLSACHIVTFGIFYNVFPFAWSLDICFHMLIVVVCLKGAVKC